MKIKRTIIMFLLIVFVTACTNIKDYSYDDIVALIKSPSKTANTYRKGYKYYLPNNIQIVKAGDNYAILDSKTENYYLYVDIISYFNNTEFTYEFKENAVYKKVLKNNNKNGYVEITLKENDQYLIEIMYNYAKIEVMVDVDSLNKALLNSINILKSVQYYSDDVISKLLENRKFSETLEDYEMFPAKDNSLGK